MSVFFGGSRLMRRGWLSRGIKRVVWLDEKYGLFTVCLPLIMICYCTVYIGCFAMDRQKELRWLRVQSLSFKEFQKQEEAQTLQKFLEITQDDYNLVNPPKFTDSVD